MQYGYRTDGMSGSMEFDFTSMAAHQQAFNKIAAKLESDGWLTADWRKAVRYEGRVAGKPAISQGRLIVVAGTAHAPPPTFKMVF